MTSPQRLSLHDAAGWIAGRARGGRPIYISGGPGEPVALRDVWQAEPALLNGVSLCALFMPGVNRIDYTSIAPNVTLDAFLATPDLVEPFRARRARVRPMAYSAIPDWLRRHRLSVAIVHVAPPNAQGLYSLGLCADAVVSAMDASDAVVGVVNAAMPAIADAPHIHADRFDILTQGDAPLCTLSSHAPTAGDAIAAHIADLVPDGACIQVGVGKLPSAILAALTDKRALRFHGGLLSAAHLMLLHAGCVREVPGALTGGIALGDTAFYDALGRADGVRIAPIAVTHDHAVMREIPHFTAINAALEVDLFGQVNAEWAGARWIASTGGLSDFARGARAAPHGRSIIAISAVGPSGESRIKARLDCPTVTLARADADVIVTEFGVAQIRDLDVEARAYALIAIAAPQHREALRAAWMHP